MARAIKLAQRAQGTTSLILLWGPFLSRTAVLLVKGTPSHLDRLMQRSWPSAPRQKLPVVLFAVSEHKRCLLDE